MNNISFNDRQILRILSRYGDSRKLRVLYVSCYGAPDYVRTESIISILKRNSIQFRFVSGGTTKFRHVIMLARMLFSLGSSDVVLIAFRGHEIVPFCRLFTRKPIVFDVFVSMYDTVCFDRKIVPPQSWAGRMLKWYDTFLCRLADEVLVDTRAHADYFKEEFGTGNVSYLYLECPEMFRPMPSVKSREQFVVFWYGNCWPLQGVDVILRAAEILKNEPDIVFRLVGPVRKKYTKLISVIDCRSVEFVEYVQYASLPGEIAKADVCLGGHFSAIPKARRVIAGKTFQFIACGKKTIVGENPANRELFSDMPGVYFTAMNSAEELAGTILNIKKEVLVQKSNFDPNNFSYWETKADDFARIIALMENNRESFREPKGNLNTGFLESLIFLYGIYIELLLKTAYLKRGKKFYPDGGELELPQGVNNGHDLKGWITFLKINLSPEGDVGADQLEKKVVSLLQDFIVDYGKYPFKKDLNKEGFLLYDESDLEDIGKLVGIIKSAGDS
ncbi:MAG: glycosyltransferase [Candidatus Omnitrophica bacterium]|nr:glycosyltransferase [Candidatus Omnitrophota bacterium]